MINRTLIMLRRLLLNWARKLKKYSKKSPFLIYSICWLLYILYTLLLFPYLHRSVMMPSILLCGLSVWLFNLHMGIFTLLLSHPYHFLMLVYCTGDPNAWTIDLEPGAIAAQFIFTFFVYALDKNHTRMEQLNQELELRVEERRGQLRQITEILFESTEAARHQLADKLCIDVGCDISVLMTHLDAMKKEFMRNNCPEKADIAKLQKIAIDCSNDIQDIVQRLSIARLESTNLADSIHQLTSYYSESLQTRFTVDMSRLTQPLPHPLIHHLYRIIHETVTNAVRHAKADKIIISISTTDDMLSLQVTNNGTPLPQAGYFGLGLRMICYRVQSIGGRLNYRSHPSSGITTFSCLIPLP
jgi:signal transduction histidine kinase